MFRQLFNRIFTRPVIKHPKKELPRDYDKEGEKNIMESFKGLFGSTGKVHVDEKEVERNSFQNANRLRRKHLRHAVRVSRKHNRPIN